MRGGRIHLSKMMLMVITLIVMMLIAMNHSRTTVDSGFGGFSKKSGHYQIHCSDLVRFVSGSTEVEYLGFPTRQSGLKKPL